MHRIKTQQPSAGSDDCVVILAGGQGSRLAPYTTVLPKPLMPIGHVPILEVVIHQLREQGFRRLFFAVGHLDGLLRSYFGDGDTLGVDIVYRKEQRPLGTMGPLRAFADVLPESFLVMNGDLLTDCDYRACLNAHRDSGCALTLGRFRRHVQLADGIIDVSPTGLVEAFREKPRIEFSISMGIYALNKTVLDLVPENESFGMDKLMMAMLRLDKPVNTYHHQGDWYDIGCPDDLQRAKEAFAENPERFLPTAVETIGAP